jgi:hypothetical protein
MFATACWLATSITRPERLIHRVHAALRSPLTQTAGLRAAPAFAMNTGAKPALCIRPELSTMHVIPLFSPEKWKKQASVSRRAARENNGRLSFFMSDKSGGPGADDRVETAPLGTWIPSQKPSLKLP